MRRHRRHVETAILASAAIPRPPGEIFARACKRLGEYDAAGVSIRLFALVSGRVGEDGRRLAARRTRRRRAHALGEGNRCR